MSERNCSVSCEITLQAVQGSSSQSSVSTTPPTHWELCVLCQKDLPEKLINPSEGKFRSTDKQSGYKSIAENILEFAKLGNVPLEINIERLDDGGGIEATLQKNAAVWHKTCRNRFDRQKLQRAQKKKACEAAGNSETSQVKTRRDVGVELAKTDKCFFCNDDDKGEPLHSASTFSVDHRVREYAHILQDTVLLGKLSEGDMHALDARYHRKCMTDLHNRVRKQKPFDELHNTSKTTEGLVLAELVSYIEDYRDNKTLPIFKLSTLVGMYQTRLQELDPTAVQKVNSTRLKDRILSMVPDLQAQQQGREVVLIFNSDVGEIVKIASAQSNDDDGIQLVRAAQIVRKEILQQEYSFDGSFQPGCEQNVVPQSLLALVRMILQGPSIQDQKDANDAMMKVALSMSELLMFNTKKKQRMQCPESDIRHSKGRESPLAIYTGLLVHAKTRQRDLVDKLSSHGLCISYNRTLEVSTNLANSVCARFDHDMCICPYTMRRNLFTVGAADNLDHNPSSRTAKDSFHGTAISLIQFPTSDNPGIGRGSVSITPEIMKKKTLASLPANYSEVPPTALKTSTPTVPKVDGQVKANAGIISASLEEEYMWLRKVKELIQKDALNMDDFISWAAYHASRQPPLTRPVSPIALLPLFQDAAHSPAMIVHAMTLVQKATHHVNAGQTPVITMDQPLFALGKQVQWNFPETHGERSFVVMMGGLHIEMNILHLLGDWLNGSGWTSILVQAGVTTSGRADAMLKGSHVTRSRYAHQVTAASLHLLMCNAYQAYTEDLRETNGVPLNFSMWRTSICDQSPQSLYWSTVLDLELLAMQFIRSIREGNFELYVQTLGQLVPWMFALDHGNYARWLPVHIRDMVQLKNVHPAVYEEFMRGHFVVQKSAHVFSTISIDQAHEQMNKKVKGDGGVIGLTENPSALLRWIVAGPEVTRVIEEFQNSFTRSKHETTTRHHEQVPSVQKEFALNVKAVIVAIEEMGNPFMEDTQDLFVLDTKQVMKDDVVQTVKNIKEIGKNKYDTFVQERLVQCTAPITDTIHKTKLPLFSTAFQKSQSRSAYQLNSLKNNCELFSRLYISCQSRNSDMAEFFKHENQSVPPSLSDMGKMRTCTKSDLAECLEACCPRATNVAPAVDTHILDGSAIVHMLAPKNCRTFQDYAQNVFVPYILKQLDHVSVKRLDIVWDRYLEHSLKAGTRLKRGSGQRVVVREKTPIPRNWPSFLRVDENKAELYSFLTKCVANLAIPGKELYSTQNSFVMCAHECDFGPDLAPCDHEEADTRLFLHAVHTANQGHHSVTIRSVDTDVLVLAIAAFQFLSLHELWVAFGVKDKFRYIPAHSIARSIGDQKARALPFFHAFTGCDTVSSFSHKGKKTAWETWMAFPHVTEAFVTLSSIPESIPDECMVQLERFVVLLYCRTSEHSSVNEARKHLFARGRQIDNIPPTQATLIEHTKRSAYQGGHCWGTMLQAQQHLPSPSDWGWKKDNNGDWAPFWTSLSEAAKSCKELIKCGCKVSCRGLCKCHKASLPCTDLCICQGSCYQLH